MSDPTSSLPPVAVLGGGNLGRALAEGWLNAGTLPPDQIWVTRRQVEKLDDLKERGIRVGDDNRAAVEASTILVLAVQPQQMEALMADIQPVLEAGRHRVISVASGVPLADLAEHVGEGIPVVRAMPNTAVSIGESMTCLSTEDGNGDFLDEVHVLFDAVGRTLHIAEEMMIPATALCACGVAFFLRTIRAASQGGIEIGFHPEEALFLAAQTARGAAGLLGAERHPEAEIDRVTTPRGCTIAGLNEMEHNGLSSAFIKGIILSAEKAGTLYD
jgi:pyrroline-5-carboxylate reductase